MSKFDNDESKFKIRTTQQMASAVTGAIATSLFMTPLDVVKTRIQAQQKRLLSDKCFLYCNGLMDHLCPCGPDLPGTKKTVHLNGTVDGLVKIARAEGITSLWSGLGPTLISALPSTVIYFVTYEQFKERYLKIYSSLNKNYDPAHHALPIFIPLISGVSARVLSVTCVCPLELMRTKMQSEKLNYFQLRQAIKSVLQIDGVIGLYKGLKPTILRDVPFSGIYWSCYETIKSKFLIGEPTFGFSFFAGATSGTIAAFLTTPFDVIKTHQQIEFGEKFLYADQPPKTPETRSMFNALQTLYQTHGIRGLFAGLSPRIFKVAPACAIMIGTFEYGKLFFFHHNKSVYFAELAHD